MSSRPPIPTPPRVLVQEYVGRFAPLLVFVAAVAAVVLLWDYTSTGIPGMGEAEPSLVSAPGNGVLVQVLVDPFQMVAAGQPLAVYQTDDARTLLDQFQAELSLARLKLQPDVAQDNAVNLERLRLELLNMRADLAVARVQLAHATREVERYTPLKDENLVTADVYELALVSRDALTAEVEERALAVREMESRMDVLASLGFAGQGGVNPQQALFDRLESMRVAAVDKLQPVTLTAPISGMVHRIFRRSGENLVAGEMLFDISPERADRIVAYLRQPYPADLEPGMPVDVLTQERVVRRFESQIIQVGARQEIITNSLAFLKPFALVDSGLPFVIGLPDGLDLRPGEKVDIVIRSNESPADEEPSGPPPI